MPVGIALYSNICPWRITVIFFFAILDDQALLCVAVAFLDLNAVSYLGRRKDDAVTSFDNLVTHNY